MRITFATFVTVSFFLLGFLNNASSAIPSFKPTLKPTLRPTLKPTAKPTALPTRRPTVKPSQKPTRIPTTVVPSSIPTSRPSSKPSAKPSGKPSSKPSAKPSVHPSSKPSSRPTSRPTASPTSFPSFRSVPLKKEHSTKQSLSGGGIAGIVIALFIVFVAGLYVARNHYSYVQRFINVTGLSGYGYLNDDTQNAAKTNSGDGRDVEMLPKLNDSVDNPIWSAVDSPIAPRTLSVSSKHSNLHDNDNSPNDDETLENVTIVGVSKSGYLMKRSTHRNWLRRWFFIKEGHMYYTHKPFDNSTVGKKAITAVPVANLLISTVRNASNKEFQIISPGQRGVGLGGGIYELMAETEADAADWVRIIKLQIEGSLTRNLPSESDQQPSDGSPISDTTSPSALFVPGPAILKELKRINPTCADCGAGSPTWASLNLCLMMCIECSGIHRSMGSHISKVRSTTLDKWSVNSLQLLKTIGNNNANAMWEEKFDPSNEYFDGPKHERISASSDRETRELFINCKYARRAYLTPNALTHSERINSFLTAASIGDLLQVMHCLVWGLDVNATEISSSSQPQTQRKTPLMLACAGGHALCVELLCQWGASLELRDGDGQNAQDFAATCDNTNVLEIIKMFVK